MNKILLRKLYSIHSPSGGEDEMADYIRRLLMATGITKVTVDEYGNLYATRGEATSYPCVVAHIDQVQKYHPDDFAVVESQGMMFGYSKRGRRFCGLGADDKNGIYIAICALWQYPVMKAAFFRSEETGCQGSMAANMDFFTDCRFVLQCDRRGDSDLITSIGGLSLCSDDFLQAIDAQSFRYGKADGLMTDVEALKENGLSVSAINMSCGYYDPHTDYEHTDLAALDKCFAFVCHIIEQCTDVYPHEPEFMYGKSGTDYEWTDDDIEAQLSDEIYDVLKYTPEVTEDDLFDYLHGYYPDYDYTRFCDIVTQIREEIAHENSSLSFDDELTI